jgi:hypothetical protein
MALSKKARKRKRTSVASRRQVPADVPEEEVGPDDAAAFIAEMLVTLTRMARRQRLDVLSYLLAMAQLEAEEHVRLRSRGRLS